MPDPDPTTITITITITITELGERTGKASSALRYYEREHLLRPCGRRGGRRVYAAGAVEQVALIDLLQVAGLTIGEIRAIVSPVGVFADDWREQAHDKIARIDRQLRELELARSILEHTVNCPHGALEECPTFQRGLHDHAVALAGPLSDEP